MLTYLETHIDLSPASPKVITDSFAINCTDTSARYKINADIPHAFLVRTAADITVKNASGNALTKDDDFFLKQSKRDAYYSTAYSLSSIFSEIQFAEVGVYTVTRHLCVGTYVNASFLNALKLQIKTWLEETIPAIQSLLSSHTSSINTHSTAISQLASDLPDEIEARETADETLTTNLTTHVNNTTDAHGAVSTPTASTIIVRDANGRAQVANPSADNDIANKSYVDSKVVAAGGGDVISATDTSVGGHVVTYNDDYGHTINDSGYAIGNASGNIPLSNMTENLGLISQRSRLLFYRSSSGTNSILNMALSDFATYGQGLHYYAIKASDPASPWTVDSQAVLMGYPNYARLIAFKLHSKAIAIRILNGGTWEPAWTYLTDDNGNAMFPSVATTASAANAYIGANGTTILKSTSSKRYKTDIRDLDDSSTLDQLRPVLYKSNPETVPSDDPTLDHYGFIAEDIDEFDNKLVQYIINDEGEKVPDGVQYDRITVLLVKRVQELKYELSNARASADSLSEKVKTLEDRLTKAGIQ